MRILCLGRIAHELGVRDLAQLVNSAAIGETPDLILAGGDLLLGHAAAIRRLNEEWPDSGMHLLILSDTPLARPAIREMLGAQSSWVRPANLPPGAPGEGFRIWKTGEDRLGVVSLVTDSERSLDDVFQGLDDLMKTSLNGVPVLVLAHGREWPLKQALFWRGARERLPVHVLGFGLGVATTDPQIVAGRCWVADIGSVGRDGGIEGMDPEIWWKRHRERIPVDPAPPPGRLVGDALLLDLDSDGRGRSVKQVRLGTETRK